METTKRQRGRPRKKPDTIPFWRFVRSATAICGYDEARKRGEKRNVAIAEAVDFVRELHPGMPISETEVKRILAAWRPHGYDDEVFSFERFCLSEEDIERQRMIQKLLMLQASKGSRLPIPNLDLSQAKVFRIRISKRPEYPRHNAKNPPNNLNS